ncbi:MAG TPA: hypothetical protein VN426_17130 [Syntrophomonadaceae bacterium]|nr:hypothetical protein [Syntrophomonadaceae bacterium]
MRLFSFEPIQAIKNKLRTPIAHVDMEEIAEEEQTYFTGDDREGSNDCPDPQQR